MRKVSIKAGRFFIAALFVTSNICIATQIPPEISLELLRDQINKEERVSGDFIQCTIQGSANISAYGNYNFAPGSEIEFRFIKPSRYSLKFFRDGTQTKTVGGFEQKSADYNQVVGLIFSIMSMQKSSLDNRFEVDLQGSIDQFSMSLKPRKRLSKLLESIQITGATGTVNSIQITTRNHRMISISLFPSGEASGITCG